MSYDKDYDRAHDKHHVLDSISDTTTRIEMENFDLNERINEINSTVSKSYSTSSSPRSSTQPISMHRRFRDKLKEIIDNPSSSITARIYFAFIASLITTSIIILVLDSFEFFIENPVAITAVEGVVTLILLFELAVRFYASVNTRKDAWEFLTNFTNIADFLSCVPFFIILLDDILQIYPSVGILRVFRLLRLMRILNISKRMRTLFLAIRKSLTVISCIMVIIFLCVLVSSTIEYYLERGTYMNDVWTRIDGTPSPFSSVPASMWWSILTLLAVGYGDVVPITPAGKIAGAITMVVGIMLISTPSLILSNTYTELLANDGGTEVQSKQEQKNDMMLIMERQTRVMENVQLMMHRQERMMKDVEFNSLQIRELSKVILRSGSPVDYNNIAHIE
ncbi:potassium voltage-gated channel subfamily B member [Acrasis kona]|uniref:Potassium voltage-gated channel subfamily B member n=1 Tax=Acrasis kona TaxID=1008807 RepID=A0AAW2Z0T7_9EUKA